MKTKNPIISIIIKTLNEEANIKRTLDSCIKATKDISAEIILADSLSTDKTIAIAKKYPIRIVQLINPEDRSCGIGPQLGYQYAKGDFIYILDGDMEFEKNFLETAINEFNKDSTLGGVAGQVREMRAVNIVFKNRQKSTNKKVTELEFVDKLEMGGIYRRKALESIGYFSNRNLHAYEEADLGFQLINNGWKLCRLPVPGIKHYGYDTTSFGVFRKRWKTGYVKGSGELLRAALGKKHFFKVAWHLKIYVFVIFWWLLGLVSSFLLSKFVKYFLLTTGIILLLFLLKKRSIKQWLFSLISWHFSAVGLIRGFFSKQINPTDKISSKVIK